MTSPQANSSQESANLKSDQDKRRQQTEVLVRVALPYKNTHWFYCSKETCIRFIRPFFQESIRTSVHQLKLKRRIKEKKCLETQQNDFSWRKYTFPVRVWTSTWLKCFDMTSRHWFTPHIPRILLFCKRNSAFFLTIVWLCGEGHKRSTSYQTTSLQTLNCECLQCVFSTDMKTSLFVCVCILLLQSRANFIAEIHGTIQATVCTICL